MKVKERHLWLSIVLFVFGFMVAISYQYAQKTKKAQDFLWERESNLQSELIAAEEKSLKYEQRLRVLKEEVEQEEQKKQSKEADTANIVQKINEYRLITGEKDVSGPGVVVTLSDSQYELGKVNPNDYIVHERHIRQVISELNVAGAEAISVNGQRLTNRSYISCIGPVILVDGKEFPAPFTIEAIGNQTTLHKALTLKGSLVDQLVQDGIEVKIETKDKLEMRAVYGREGAIK
ncbi:DUF881 domain-containing protein [Massilibacterium senegalense]|uniref:DUF881 domain-containing protein n=1 Tax=Massilibacterium senegalense TaxID=1632858 RepID=UPI000782D056|nr:DUF881 domain-containing protein [Massilibacterium senegalense]